MTDLSETVVSGVEDREISDMLTVTLSLRPYGFI